ncbi:peptidase inhibitor family I36 protein [Streptomyces niveiscabiei]|uniref:peptidase inhibitor family I36 protein n=1 Tax=Streptomyces niveiscabiei TaxID=164115 RepID=UPI0029B68F41|nr:peptidase inhibitor family I36 protein [Streptomyces niveiscabiei]MDX3386058.1 peptidase inhibitor family I36 protein [Streptomyces niveiscabiei]
MNVRSQFTKRASALLCGTALALGAGSAAAAAPDQAPRPAASKYAAEAKAVGLSARQAAQLQDRVDAQLADMKVPAEQLSYNEIRAKDSSATITMSVPGVTDTSCDHEYLCLWQGANWTGTKLSLSVCAFRDLNDYAFNNDTLTSYKNNQTRGTVAKFYNWEGGRWVQKFSSTAPHTEDSLANTPWDNMIDGVRVC